MDTYKTSRDRFRQQDAMAEAMRKRQRKLGKGKRKALIERAITMQFPDKQREQGTGA